jgi:hypothetical protein
MPEYAYTTVTGKIKPLLDKIRTAGVPPKVNEAWLKTVGFKSSNDRSLIGVLKSIGLIDQTGIPTPRWSAYRGADHRAVLGQAIRTGYADLYAVYPEAHTQSNADLQDVFSTDACAVMLRRLIETLIIETFEHHKIVGKIQSNSGDFLYLRGLIDKALAEKTWNLSRNAKQALPKLKDIGDKSAHSRRYLAQRGDIQPLLVDIRTVVQELTYLSGVKK